jgi:hypothetical protein
MTKNDFISRQRAAKREENIVSIVWIVIFFAVLLANVPLSSWFDRNKPAVWIKVTYLCLIFGFFIGNLVLMIWSAKRRYRKFGLHCPACDKPLTHVAGQIAIATGNCGHCGVSLFEQ